MNVLFGAATNHAIREAEPFLASVGEQFIRTQVQLLVYSKDMKRPELAALACKFPFLRVRTARRLGRRIRPWVLRIDRATGGRMRCHAGWQKILRGCLHITLERFLHALEFLQDRRGFVQALGVCDIRDVLVQGDPFESLPEKVVTGEEGELMERCQTNAGWYRELFGPKALEKVAACRILCSGATLGRAAPMAWYLQAMAKETGARINQIGERGYFDQAIHNRVLRSGEIDFEASPVPGGRISTLGYPRGAHVTWGPDKGTVLVDGIKPALVHQYDRVLKP